MKDVLNCPHCVSVPVNLFMFQIIKKALWEPNTFMPT